MSFSIKLFNISFREDYLQICAVVLLSLFPVFFFIGTGILNLGIIILDLIFIVEIISKKRLYFLKNYIFYSLILLWLTLLINVFFSINPVNSFSRGFGFIRFIFFVMLLIYFFNLDKQKFKNFILTCWLIIFLITSVDLLFEFFTGKNLLGFESYIGGRLAGFFNDELIIGHFYYGFILIATFYILQILSKKNKQFFLRNYIYFFIFIFLIISFLIGERSNFIKVLIMILFFSFLFEKEHFKLKVLLFSGFFLVVLLFINLNSNFKERFYEQIYKAILDDPTLYFDNLRYTQHYKTAIRIYDNNKIFGIGLKNYRIESGKKVYQDLQTSTHPHQVHFEFLSELGILGYLSLIIFFIYHFYNFRKNKFYNDNLNLAGLLFVITSLLPLLPSGSFFTSNGATLFWMNFAMMTLNQKKINYEFFR